MGAKFTSNELEDVGIPDKPQYVLHANKDQNKMAFPDLNEEVMPKVDDEYANVSMILLHGSQMMCSTIITPKWGRNGNPIGHWSDDSILDTLLHDLEFLDCEVTLLAANIIL